MQSFKARMKYQSAFPWSEGKIRHKNQSRYLGEKQTKKTGLVLIYASIKFEIYSQKYEHHIGKENLPKANSLFLSPLMSSTHSKPLLGVQS